MVAAKIRWKPSMRRWYRFPSLRRWKKSSISAAVPKRTLRYLEEELAVPARVEQLTFGQPAEWKPLSAASSSSKPSSSSLLRVERTEWKRGKEPAGIGPRRSVLQRTARCCAKTVPKVYGIEGKGVLSLSESRRPELV